MNTSYIFLAPGFEEIEALTVLDVMRRAGMDVKTVSITDERNVAGAHGVTVTADLLYSETDFITPEWLILPGGMPGTKYLAAHEGLTTLIKNCHKNKKYLAAICAAPIVYGELHLLSGKHATCYPGFEEKCMGAIMEKWHSN